MPVAPTVESLKNAPKIKGVSEFVKFGSKKNLFLSDYLNVKSSTPLKRSDAMRALDAYALLYVVQSKSDREKGIYKLGVSPGVGRLPGCFKMHGDSIGRCSGVYLIYLAAQKKSGGAPTKQWNYKKEAQIKATLITWGIPAIRGKEWIGISDENYNAFKLMVTMPRGEATQKSRKEMFAAIQADGEIKSTDDVLEVVRHLKGNKKETAGEIFYQLKWRNPQIETHDKNWMSKPPKKTHLNFESLKQMKKIKSTMNNTRSGMGDNAIKLINAYIVKKNLQSVDKSYK